MSLLSLTDLKGAEITGWSGVEMALWEEGPEGPPVFVDPAVPCRQFLVLRIAVQGSPTLQFGTVQGEDGWGLGLHAAPPASAGELGSIYREVDLPTLPLGRVESVALHHDRLGLVERARVTVGGRPLLLVAGESYEDPQGRLYFLLGDESVILFEDPADFERVDWRNA